MSTGLLRVPTILVLVSSGYVCGLSVFVGIAISNALKLATTDFAKNVWTLVGMINALLCGAAPIFLLAILVFSHEEKVIQRALFFSVAVVIGMASALYISWKGSHRTA